MLLIKNAHVKTMEGVELDCGQVLMDAGKIVAVGTQLEVSDDAQVIDAQGKLVTPGLVDAHCHVGVEDSSMSGQMGHDCNEMSDPATPQVRAIDSIYPQDEAICDALRAGVTTAVTGPGSGNVIGGTFVAIKTCGNRVDDMVVKNPVAMKVAFGENPKNVYGTKNKLPMTRMGTASVLREYLFKAKRYLEDKEAGKNPAFDMKLEAMLPVIRKEIPLKAHAHRADDILTAIRIAKEFDVGLTLDHCTDGALIVDQLIKEGYDAIVGPSFTNKSKCEVTNKSFKTPGVLAKAGMKVAIMTDAPVTPLEYLPICAGLAIKNGMEEEMAWKAVTIHAAEITGISDRVGSIKPGKDADVVIWEADPLHEISARPYKVIVNGEVVVG